MKHRIQSLHYAIDCCGPAHLAGATTSLAQSPRASSCRPRCKSYMCAACCARCNACCCILMWACLHAAQPSCMFVWVLQHLWPHCTSHISPTYALPRSSSSFAAQPKQFQVGVEEHRSKPHIRRPGMAGAGFVCWQSIAQRTATAIPSTFGRTDLDALCHACPASVTLPFPPADHTPRALHSLTDCASSMCKATI